VTKPNQTIPRILEVLSIIDGRWKIRIVGWEVQHQVGYQVDLVLFGLASWKSALKAKPWALRQMTSLVLLFLNISLNYSLLPD
jgi:hypothetical protein